MMRFPKRCVLFLIKVVIFIGINEGVSVISLLLLGLPNRPLPWDWIRIASQGFYSAVIIAWLFTAFASVAGVLMVQGGLQRAIGQSVCLGLSGFLIVNTLTLIVFGFWTQSAITGYPWTTYQLISTLPLHSEAMTQFILCALGASLVVTLIASTKSMSALEAAKKTFGQAHFATAIETYRAGLFASSGIVLGIAYGKILRLNGFESVLVTAPTGSGKTAAIAIPNCLEWQGSGIFNDLKGELFKLTGEFRQNKLQQQVYCFAPANPQLQTHGYNPFFYVSDNPNLMIRDLQLIAEILIPSERVDGGFWYTSARDLFILLAIYLIETNGIATLAELHDVSKQENFFEWLYVQVKEEAINNPVFYQNANSLLNSDAEKTQKNILKDFHSRMTLFADPMVRAATRKNDFDLRKLRQEKMSIYLNIPDSDKERLRPLLTLFWAQCIHVLTQTEPNLNEEPYPVLALLDEFGNMARINKLKEGMSFLRSYRVRAVVIVQYLSQIISTYGQHDAKGFLNTKVKIAFALNDLDDAKFFSASLGNKTVKVRSSSSSMGQHESSSKNTSFQSRPLMTPDEIMQLKKDDEIILLEAAMPVRAKKCWWFRNKFYK